MLCQRITYMYTTAATTYHPLQQKITRRPTGELRLCRKLRPAFVMLVMLDTTMLTLTCCICSLRDAAITRIRVLFQSHFSFLIFF